MQYDDLGFSPCSGTASVVKHAVTVALCAVWLTLLSALVEEEGVLASTVLRQLTGAGSERKELSAATTVMQRRLEDP